MVDMEWIVDGDHYNIRMNGRLHKDIHFFKLDAGHKHVDVFHHETPPGAYGGKLKSIYQVSRDSLKVCFYLVGQQYPKSFDSSRGSRHVIYEFQRE